MEIPGVGPSIASALVAVVGTGSSFAKGRDLAVWLGVVPRKLVLSRLRSGLSTHLCGLSFSRIRRRIPGQSGHLYR